MAPGERPRHPAAHDPAPHGARPQQGPAPGGATTHGLTPDHPLHKPLLKVALGQRLDPPPVWLMRQAGRYLPEYRALRAEVPGFLELVFDPARATEVTLQPLRRFALDAAILFSDILVIPWAMGQPVRFVEGEGPQLDPITTTAQLSALRPQAAAQRLSPVLETVARVRAQLEAQHPGVALIGFAGAPWTVAAYMVEGGSPGDFLAIKSWWLREPQAVLDLIQALVTATIAYGDAQIRAGAEAFMLFDSWAGALSDFGWAELVEAPTRAIVTALKAAHPGVPVIGLPRLAGPRVAGYRSTTGVDVVALDPTLPLGFVAGQVQSGGAVQGCLDPVTLRAGGAALDQQVRAICDGLAGGPHIFNLGHGVIRDTPPEHVAQLVSAVRSWRRQD